MSDTPALKPVILTLIECILANAAFAGLDGFNKTNAAGERVHVPFKFTDEVRVKIRRWKRAIKEAAEEYADLEREVVEELSPKEHDVSKEELKVRVESSKRLKALQEQERTFVLPKLRLEGELLNDGKNPIPDTVLDALDKIIEDTPAPAEPAVAGGE